MTRDDIRRMAREIGREVPSGPEGVEFFFYPEELERFAALVIKVEREACAELADRVSAWCRHPDEIAKAIRAKGVEIESREARAWREIYRFTRDAMKAAPDTWGILKGIEAATLEAIEQAVKEQEKVVVKPSAPRKPLTDEEITKLTADTWGSASIAPQSVPEFARAIERAHGIGGEE